MSKKGFRKNAVLLTGVVLLALVSARLASPVASAEPAQAPALNIQDFPIMNMAANKLIQKYQTSTCEQLWQQRSQKNKPKTTQEQEALGILRNDPQMRTLFINAVAAPIANKMFECGMIP